MLQNSAIEKLISIIRKDLKRSLRLHISGYPRPYYVSFLLRDTEWFNTWAGGGSVFRKRSDHTRNVYCDMRVGNYRYDQVTEGGLNDNDKELESYGFVTVPIDDRVYDGLRLGLWRLTDAKYREAIQDYNNRRTRRVSSVDPNTNYRSFTPLRPLKFAEHGRAESIDEERWVRYCKTVSKWLSELPGVTTGWVEFDGSQQTRVFVSSEGREIVQHTKMFSLSGTIRALSRDGSQLEQDLVINCGSQMELPDIRSFKRMMVKKYERLQDQIRARKIHSFTGPVLLYPDPAGLLIHEAIGHRLEGSRLVSSSEGQTFKDKVGRKVVNVPLTIRDNPKQRKFNGKLCVGYYQYDDEGTEANDTLLVKAGIHHGFLTTRSQVFDENFEPNGHARNKKFERPISRMAVTIIEGEEPHSLENLKRMLVHEVKKSGKPYGMIIYDTSGGETDTQSYDFQAFSGEVSYATLIYPDGKEVPVRGVDFVGTPLQALNSIIAVGKEQELNNGYCGAESGFIPISTISPAILLSNLELQSKQEELVTQYILKKPVFKKKRRKKKRK